MWRMRLGKRRRMGKLEDDVFDMSDLYYYTLVTEVCFPCVLFWYTHVWLEADPDEAAPMGC
jgi:hypothetical protein